MGYPKSFNSWIDTKTIVNLLTKNRFKTVEEKTIIKTYFNKHSKISLQFISSQSSRNRHTHATIS